MRGAASRVLMEALWAAGDGPTLRSRGDDPASTATARISCSAAPKEAAKADALVVLDRMAGLPRARFRPDPPKAQGAGHLRRAQSLRPGADGAAGFAYYAIGRARPVGAGIRGDPRCGARYRQQPGFIGFFPRLLMARGDVVAGFDVVNDYYDRRSRRRGSPSSTGLRPRPVRPTASTAPDLADGPAVEAAFTQGVGAAVRPVIHLAARPACAIREPARLCAVEPARLHPYPEAAAITGCRRISPSPPPPSVYGGNTTMPFEESRRRPSAAIHAADQRRTS